MTTTSTTDPAAAATGLSGRGHRSAGSSGGPLARLARLLFRRRWIVLVATVLFVVGSAATGLSVFDRLSSGGFDDPAAESTRATQILAEQFDAAPANLVVLVDPDGDSSVASAGATSAGRALQAELEATAGVQRVQSFWSTRDSSLRSDDAQQALLLVRLAGDENAVDARSERIINTYRGGFSAAGTTLQVRFGGEAATGLAFNTTIAQDLARAESVAVPISLVLLVLVFGSLVAATLPVLVAGIAVAGTFLSLFLISLFTDVSVFAINLTTALGLGLAIDYSLFLVSRFREELAVVGGSRDRVEEALVATMTTAGRTVAFSALTVAMSLSALLVFPLYFLRSFGYAGIAVVLVAAAGALIALPALLAVLGPRVNRFAVRRSLRRPITAASGESGFWAGLARVVMRRPILVGAPVAVALAALALPFLGVNWGLPDDRALPPGSQVRVVADTLRADFPANAGGTTTVVLPTATPAQAGEVAAAVSRVDGVLGVETVAGRWAGGERAAGPGAGSGRFARGGGAFLRVDTDVEAFSGRGQALVEQVRALDLPVPALVTGRSAELLDTRTAIFGLVPLALGIVALTTFVLLFLMTGSLLVPAKAIVLNVLSLGATFGAMVWLFQEGHGAHLLNFTPTGLLDTSVPILMFCIAFGLSMDYEVFLISRIKEAHDRTGDTTAAVATGLQRTGRIMTAAAGILAVTFLAFSTSGVTFIKLMGLGLTLAVLLDATLVRGLLVPAFMRLAGEANWWAPRPLRRLYARFGITEG